MGERCSQRKRSKFLENLIKNQKEKYPKSLNTGYFSFCLMIFRYFIFGSYEKNLITAITLPKIVTFFTMIGSIKSFSGWRRKTPSSL